MNSKLRTALSAFIAAALLLSPAVRAQEPEAASPAPAQPDAAAIEGRVAAIEKKLAEPAKPGGPEVKLGAVVQADGRFYQDSEAAPFTDTFLLRRVRLDATGKLGATLSGRIQIDLAGGALQTLDAYADARWIPGVVLRVGKFTPPVGYERLVSTPGLAFIEYAQTSNLVPNRDIGVQASGDVGPVSWALGAFDGTADAGNNETDTSDDKDVVARVAVKPIEGLTVHASGSHGSRKYVAGATATAALAQTLLPSYRADSQGGTYFSYVTGVAAKGEHTRYTGAVSYYLAGFGFLGEYAASRQRVVRVDAANTSSVIASARPTQVAWQVLASYVVSGEKNSEGALKPASPMDAGGLGALRVKARYQQLVVDEDLFVDAVFADPARSAKKATALNAGLDWWATASFRFELEYSQTSFEGGAAGGADRKTEKAILSRAQLAF